MNQLNENKEFIIRYYNTLSGVPKTDELVDEFTTDEELKQHIAFFDAVFPNYELFADEMIAEDNRVVVRARCKGRHEGVLNGIMPTYRDVEFPFVISYTIENGKITDHWMIADQVVLMEQLGAMNTVQG